MKLSCSDGLKLLWFVSFNGNAVFYANHMACRFKILFKIIFLAGIKLHRRLNWNFLTKKSLVEN